MYDFVESVKVEMPAISKSYTDVKESAEDVHLIVEIAAIHEGVTANYTEYSREELERSVATWVTPYARPVITNHDVYSEPIGRVMASRLGDDRGRACLWLQVAVPDAESVEKFQDSRYLTGSVGGQAESALCSICGADWASTSIMMELPCEHRRGQVYENTLCTLKMTNITWREYSMVNVPADSDSGVRSIGGGVPDEEEDEVGPLWVKASIFAMDEGDKSIFDATKEQAVDILESKSPDQASEIYNATRGAFLSAIAGTNNDLNKEINMSKDESLEEDVLAISENLAEKMNEISEESEDDTTEVSEEKEVETEEPTEDADPIEDDNTEEGDPEGQEKGQEGGSEDGDEGGEEEDGGETSDEEVVSEDDTDTVEPTEPEEEVEDLSGKVEELEAEVERLTEENANLKAAVKRSLAERVVDAKISRGMESASDRATLIEEHTKRTASSLADSMVDLIHIKVINPVEMQANEARDLYKGKSNVNSENDDTRVTTAPETTSEVTENATETDEVSMIENHLVDGLMGRSKL